MVKKSEAVIQLLQRLDVLDRVRELHKQNKHPKSIEQLFDEGTNIDSMFYFPEDELEYWDIISKMIQIVLDGVDTYNEEELEDSEKDIIETLDSINKRLDDVIIKQQQKESVEVETLKGIVDALETMKNIDNENDVIRFMKLDGNGYVAEVAGKDYGFEDTERLLSFLQDYLEDRSIVEPENKYFN